MRIGGISELARGSVLEPRCFHQGSAPLSFRPAACRIVARACRRDKSHVHFSVAGDNRLVESRALESAPLPESDREPTVTVTNTVVISSPDAAVTAAVLNDLDGIGTDNRILR